MSEEIRNAVTGCSGVKNFHQMGMSTIIRWEFLGMSTIMTSGAAQVTAMAVSRRGNCLLVGGGDGAVSICKSKHCQRHNGPRN